ncbi:hypothetical protein BD289DRAFT_176342 [Coniella lustricola]|uniref:Mitochondrial cardiolipin hydrolase n=1 Tax=Coniella lustricola TaxID=2025994 RepID=A0A2T2ZTL0_9PEZI|nr:hypothetical protein BD289DRAFT_176342 [Coniella lustricola]
MARGRRNGDDAWRPSAEDAAIEANDELLEEDLFSDGAAPVEHPSTKKSSHHTSSPAKQALDQPIAHHQKKKTTTPSTSRKSHRSHRADDGDDGAWKPTDEDIEDEELEVQEMVNNQISLEEAVQRPQTPVKKKKASGAAAKKPTTSRRKPAAKSQHQDIDSDADDDELWQPEDEEEDEEYLNSEEEPLSDEDEVEEGEEEADEEAVAPSSANQQHHTPKPKPTKKRPAASSAGSPNQTKKPGPRPKHRLTQATNRHPPSFLVQGDNAEALFTFAAYRGEGMCMLAMNWKNGDQPPDDFGGFAIEYKEPQAHKWWPIPNYMTFPGEAARSGPDAYSSRLSPIQRFRWVHFPFSVDVPGHFRYRVTPVFIKSAGGEGEVVRSYGEAQEVSIQLMADTFPGQMNIAFTRGFISSKAFNKKFGDGGISSILPDKANDGLEFKPKDPEMEEKALAWMGFEAREVILSTLNAAIDDTTAQVRVLAYDLNSREVVELLEKLGKRLKIIIDDSKSHDTPEDAESKAAARLERTAGKGNVQRQHMGNLQHNKLIVVDGDKTKIAIGGSTNFSWRGLYVQNNNLLALQGAQPVEIFTKAFENYWAHPNDTDGFYKTASSQWCDLGLKNVDAQVTFSPHSSNAGTLDMIASDIKAAESSLFYSLAFLYETPGVIREAIETKTAQRGILVYGLSDKSVGGLDVASSDGNPPIAYPDDFDNESSGGSGARMHHKFVVVDFNKPTARVYTGSHNFSVAADTKNAENLFMIRDQSVATAYMIEAVSMFDHYEVRDHVQKKEKAEKKGEKHTIHLKLPPESKKDKPWWDQYWTVKQKMHDRELFGV